MLALPNDRWRWAVEAYIMRPPVDGRDQKGYTGALRSAGWPDTTATRVTAHHIFHDARVQEALVEEGAKRLKAMLPMALNAVEDIMSNPQAKDADRAKVALGILDRAGLAAQIEHKVTVGLAGDTAMLARIKMLAQLNGIPLTQLLGDRLAAQMVDITPPALEHTVEEPDEFADEEY